MKTDTKKMCKKHKPKRLGYLEWCEWAEIKRAKGQKQEQCSECGYYFFKDEI